MTVHFICRGNTYRSRLSETYLNSKNLPNIKAISSGIEADYNLSGPIFRYTQRIIKNENLQNFEKPMWQKTTKDLLSKGDYTIFLKKDIYDFCVNNLGFNGKNFEIWDIDDFIPDQKSEPEIIEETEKTYDEIKKKVDELIINLQNS